MDKKIYKIKLFNKNSLLKIYKFTNLVLAEDCYFKLVNLSSVLSGYNTVKLEILNKNIDNL